MATWSADNAVVFLYNSTTGEWDTSTHTVEFQPIHQAYPTGKVAASVLSCGYAYKPDSDLDDDYHYDIYVDSSAVRRLLSPKSVATIGA